MGRDNGLPAARRGRALMMLLLVLALWPGLAAALEVEVAEPFLELHTGPGRAYPVFHVVEQGERVDVFRQRTDWFQVRTAQDVEGWVHRRALLRTRTAAGTPPAVATAGRDSFEKRRWEAGFRLGALEGATLISAYGAYALTENLYLQLTGSQALGDFSDSLLGDVALGIQPFPDWRLSPYFALGTGVIHTEPAATLVQARDRTDQFGYVGVGLRAHVGRRLLLRAGYRNLVVFTSRNENEELDEWHAGLAFFF